MWYVVNIIIHDKVRVESLDKLKQFRNRNRVQGGDSQRKQYFKLRISSVSTPRESRASTNSLVSKMLFG